jgi:Tol biopolymer transport system component
MLVRRMLPAVLILVVAVAVAAEVQAATSAQTRRVNLGSAGVQGDDDSFSPRMSADRRVVAFESRATNLVVGDTNGTADVFVRDRKTNKTRRMSVSSTGAQGNAASEHAAVSANGRFVAFQSDAADLVGGDTNGTTDVFVRDRKTGKTRRVSVNSSGTQGDRQSGDSAISANGRFVAFHSLATNLGGGGNAPGGEIFVRDRKTNKTRIVSVSNSGIRAMNDSTGDPAISASGRFVAFYCADPLVGGDTNGSEDVFIRDRKTNKTRIVSVNLAGVAGNRSSSGPAVSQDGRFVVFHSSAFDLVTNDTNGVSDIFVRGALH